MNILNNFVTYIVLYILLDIIFTQYYKLATKNATKDGALTIILQMIGGFSVLLLIPFFNFTFPTNYKIYIFLFISTILYAISDRLNTTIRGGVEASVFSMLHQISNVFLIILGITLFKEPIILTKVIGAALIIFSNMFIFYKKGSFKINKYVILAIFANLSIAIAMFVDVSISQNFCLPIYIATTLIVPAIIIFAFERLKFKDIKEEFIKGNKKAIVITGCTWGAMLVFLLRAYQLGTVTVIAPLSSLAVILNVIAGYIFLKERDNLAKKIIAAILIVISIILIKL